MGLDQVPLSELASCACLASLLQRAFVCRLFVVGGIRALLGAQARTVYCIEDGTATRLLEAICASTGDTHRIVDHHRLAPLTDANSALVTLAKLREGDCVIAFGRKQLLALKLQIEHLTGMKCAIIYGALPPDVRKEQARLFNDPTSEYKVCKNRGGKKEKMRWGTWGVKEAGREKMVCSAVVTAVASGAGCKRCDWNGLEL